MIKDYRTNRKWRTKKEKRYKNVKIFLGVFTFFVLMFLIMFYTNQIKSVEVEGNEYYSKKEIEEEKVEEEIFRDATELFQEEAAEEKEEEIDIEEKKEEDVRVPVTLPANELIVENQEKVSEETIINSISGSDDEYATYHIHLVSDGESVETICTMYNSNLNILADYNDLNNLASGDKLIIPDKNE